MKYYSTLAGPYSKLPKKGKYIVEFENLLSHDSPFYRLWARCIAYGALIFVIVFAAIVFQPTHWVINLEPNTSLYLASLIMLICLILLQVFVILGTISATRSTLKAKNPIPVRPARKLKVAFATTRAPGEPIRMVKHTLLAIKAVRYKQGSVDVWLLDETGSLALFEFCEENDIHYFSRKGEKEWNRIIATPQVHSRLLSYLLRVITLQNTPVASRDKFYAAKTKHGNFNSWIEYLKQDKYTYDILAGVDTDQVPEVNYLERMLGYFRDPDVAYVVGPQVYGNYAPGLQGLVSRWAESQASFFQSTIQRAGNASNSPMFVGTNYTVRMSVLDQIGGFQPCITEDMATGLAIHSKRNPDTGNTWKSVYTPDVLAIGEGPYTWAPFFTQQWRWASGTFDTWRRMVFKVIFRVPPKTLVNYFLMLTYYPMTALTWLLAITSSLTYLFTGATAILAPWSQFVSLYLMSVVMQLSLYFWNRRFNVSPHEPNGSYGFSGMLISTLTAPIYLSALTDTLRGKKSDFVVTSKGGGVGTDSMQAFRIQFFWIAVLLFGLIYGVLKGNNHPAMLVWVGGLLAICLAPVVLALAWTIRVNFKTGLLAKLQTIRSSNA